MICRVIWPLFHYLPGEMAYSEARWEAYLKANTQFADTLGRLGLKEGDVVWIHDYHLMILPHILRKRLGDKIRIGFFLHTPFPTSEIFRVLPVRKEILVGLLSSDIVGFHSFEYSRHFSACCDKFLQVAQNDGYLVFNGRKVKTSAIPIGINPDDFKPEGGIKLTELRDVYAGKHVILGVDRLDYIKGIPNKIAGFQRFLEKYPTMREKVVLLQVAVPSRSDLDEYRRLRSWVFELSGKCNGLYGSTENVPLQLINRTVNHDELLALYELADVCLISSIRDGMNLVAYEYLASQEMKRGVLVISEFTGVAHSLSGSLKINPWNPDEIADVLHSALVMDEPIRTCQFLQQFGYIKQHSAKSWGLEFIKELVEIKPLLGMSKGLSSPYSIYLTTCLAGCPRFMGERDKLICVIDAESVSGLPQGSSVRLIADDNKERSNSEWSTVVGNRMECFSSRFSNFNLTYSISGLMEASVAYDDVDLFDLQFQEIQKSLSDIIGLYGLKLAFEKSQRKLEIFPALSKHTGHKISSALADLQVDQHADQLVVILNKDDLARQKAIHAWLVETGYNVLISPA